MDMHHHKINRNGVLVVLSIILFGGLVLPVISYAGNNTAYLGKIRSAAVMGKDDIIEIDPNSTKEVWKYGEFDPREIILTSNIDVGDNYYKGTVKASLELDVKVGSLIFSEDKGIDVLMLRKTALWTGGRIVSVQTVDLMKHGNKVKYVYNLDGLMSELMEKSKWPYILKFSIYLTANDIKEKQVKYIVIEPDNKSDY